MAGKINIGNDRPPSGTREAIAYAEGRKAVTKALAYTTCPHAAGTPEFNAWDRGYNSARTLTPGTVDNCAYPVSGYLSVINLTGMTSAAAQAALVANGLTVGTITGSSGVVTDQSPAVNARVAKDTAVAFTIA